MKFPSKPKEILIWILLLVFAVYYILVRDFGSIFHVFLVTSLTLLFDAAFLTIRKIKLFRLSAACASGLILSILLPPDVRLTVQIAAPFFAMASKHFLVSKGFHIFNPVAFGVVMVSIFFNVYPSWWAVSYSLVPAILILVLVGYVAIKRVKKGPVLLAFYTSLVIISLIRHENLNFVLDYTTLFFAFVMLCEPVTSPDKPKNQLIYGALVAFLIFITPAVILQIFKDPLIFALLIGNKFSFWRERL